MSKISYKALNAPYLKGIIQDIQKASSRLGIDFFGVGALARNVWYVSNDKHARGTKDVDFAVYVPNAEVYEKLKEVLVASFGYTPVSTSAFCLVSPYGSIPLDLLPFGKIEEYGKVIMEGNGLISISLDGFKEVYAYGLVTAEIEDSDLKVCSIPSVVLLKLVAFDERPEHRPSDPLDISSILKSYPYIEDERIWSDYSFLYNDELSHEEVGVKVLGHEISEIIYTNNELVARILEILSKAIQLESNLAEKMIQDAMTETVLMKKELLQKLKEGLEEGIEKRV